MATYKVIQDIEAEDKLLGPLTLRQFVYAGIVLVLGFIGFKLATATTVFVMIPFIPPIIFFGMLAAPLGGAQSSEVWLLAKIRFMFVPRRRIWDQSGMKELVSITVPKKIEKVLTDGLSQTEVKSRLQALANTLDSRGWAVKNVNVNMFNQPSYLVAQAASDRLVAADSMPQEVPNYEVMPADDILDADNNTTAHNLDTMIAQSEQKYRQDLVAKVQGSNPAQQAQPQNYWFMNQPAQDQVQPGLTTFTSTTVLPGATPTPAPTNQQPAVDEQALLDKIHHEKAEPNPTFGHMKRLDPHGSKANEHKKPTHKEEAIPPVQPVNPEIARLASDNNLNVSTIAREANKSLQKPGDDEVVISLR